MMVIVSVGVFICATFILNQAIDSPYSNVNLIMSMNLEDKTQPLNDALARLYTHLRPKDSPVVKGFSL